MDFLKTMNMNMIKLYGNSKIFIFPIIMIFSFIIFKQNAPEKVIIFLLFEVFTPLIFAFLIMDIITQEMNEKTVEILLIKPITRFKILISKSLAMFVVIFFQILIFIFLFWLYYIKFKIFELLLIIIPSILFLTIFTLLISIITKSSNVAALSSSLYWLFEVVFRGKYHMPIFLFTKTFYPNSTIWIQNKFILIILSIFMFIVSVKLLEKSERYL